MHSAIIVVILASNGLTNAIQFLKQLKWFDDLPPSIYLQIARKLHEVSFKPGAIIFNENDPGDAMYIIKSGIVEIRREEVSVLTRERGEVIGEFALLDGAPRSSSVVAQTDVVLLKLKRNDFEKLLHHHDQLRMAILRTLTSKLRQDVDLKVFSQRDAKRKIGELEEQRNVLADALNRVPIGIILIDRNKKIILINRNAQIVIDQKDGLTLESGKVTTTSLIEKGLLGKMIQDAVLGGTRQEKKGGVIRIPRPSLKRSLSLLIAPLSIEYTIGNNMAAAAIFVSDPEAGIATAEDILKRLYHLTLSEIHLTSLLLQGKSLEEASKELKIKKNTARTYLKSIFQKTDTIRQSQLIRLLLMSPAILQPE